MKTLIEDLKKVMNSDIENKDKYMEMLINGFLREKQTEQLPIHVVSNSTCDEIFEEAAKIDVDNDIDYG
jgi:hypothetical protein